MDRQNDVRPRSRGFIYNAWASSLYSPPATEAPPFLGHCERVAHRPRHLPCDDDVDRQITLSLRPLNLQPFPVAHKPLRIEDEETEGTHLQRLVVVHVHGPLRTQLL